MTTLPSSQQYTPKLSRALPDSLIVLAQFVCHRAKVPYNPNTGELADTTNTETWGTFAEARRAYERGRYDGLGFVFAAGAGITGVDLDHCRDAQTGVIDAWAQAIIDQLDSYTEVSPSGTGVHILLLALLPDGGHRTSGPHKIELYDGGRFFTLTGDHLAGTPATLQPRQDVLSALHAELFPAPAKATPAPSQTRAAPLALDDAALIAKASQTDATFAALWKGDISAHDDDDSRADYAFAYKLAWWSNSDAAQIERIMRASGLARDKWDKRDGRHGTYLARTIHRAIGANAGRCYSGAKSAVSPCKLDRANEETPEQETTEMTGQNECCAAKDKIIANLQRELKKKQARIEELEAAQRWEKKVRANKAISATTKAVARSAIEFYQSSKPVEGKPAHLRKLFYEKIAKAAGVSERTVSTEIDKLAAMGGGEKDIARVTSAKTGKEVDRVIWAPSPALLEYPDRLQPEKPRGHGGKRVCPECGSRHLSVKIHVQATCLECGNRWETESAERILRGDEDEMAARSDAMLAHGNFSPCQDDGANAAENCIAASVHTKSLQSLQGEEPANPCSVTGGAHVYGRMRRADGTLVCVECGAPMPEHWQSFYQAVAVG